MGDILFLAHRVPFPPNRGDKIRAHHLLKKLAQLGRVHVGCFAENEEDRAGRADLDRIAATHCIVNRTKPLVLAGAEAVLAGKPVSLTAFHSARLEAWVRETISTHAIDTIVIFSGQMGQYIPNEFAGRIVIDLCDVDSAKFENYADAGERVWLNTREGRLLAREEEWLSRRADTTILISDAEAHLFKSRLQAPAMANVQVIGNGIDAAFFDPEKGGSSSRACRFSGAASHLHGSDGLPPERTGSLMGDRACVARLALASRRRSFSRSRAQSYTGAGSP